MSSRLRRPCVSSACFVSSIFLYLFSSAFCMAVSPSKSPLMQIDPVWLRIVLRDLMLHLRRNIGTLRSELQPLAACPINQLGNVNPVAAFILFAHCGNSSSIFFPSPPGLPGCDP